MYTFHILKKNKRTFIETEKWSYQKNGKKLYNERWITFFHETERYVNNLNIYNRSKNERLWNDLI